MELDWLRLAISATCASANRALSRWDLDRMTADASSESVASFLVLPATHSTT